MDHPDHNGVDPNDPDIDWYLEGILPWTAQLVGKYNNHFRTHHLETVPYLDALRHLGWVISCKLPLFHRSFQIHDLLQSRF